MPVVRVTFSGDWSGVLPAARMRREVPVAPRTSIKDLIESLGVPHTEVGAIETPADGPVRLEARVEQDLDLTVRPVPAVATSPVDPDPRFALDVHLGALAGRLRLLGFDTLYRNDWDDAALARTAQAEARWLLTRDRGLLKRRSLTRGCLVRHSAPDAQAAEIADRLCLRPLARPWSRCLRCNGVLADVPRERVADRLEPLTRRHYDRFRECGACGGVYWDGSHGARLRGMLAALGVPAEPPKPAEPSGG